MISNAITKFTIITPSYNQAAFLERTIKSVVSQEGDFSIEYIVMDGGSNDGSVEIIKKFDKQLKNNDRINFIWKSEKDRGQSDAINKGMRIASGDVVAYLNSDDTYAPGTLQKVTLFFQSHAEASWLTGYCKIINEHNQAIQGIVSWIKNTLLRHYSYRKLLLLNFIAQPATFWKRGGSEKSGLFDEKLHYTMDYDLWLRLGAKSNPIILTSDLANFRIHSSSKGGSEYLKQFDQDYQTVTKYTKNKLILFIHRFNNFLITTSYRFMK